METVMNSIRNVRRVAGVLAGLASAWLGLAMAAPLYGQTPGEPRLFWSVFVGYRAGERLWVLHDQPFGVLVPSGDTAVLNSPGQYDTLDLVRRSTPSLLIGTTGAYFPTPGLGFEAELAFLGMSLESSCAYCAEKAWSWDCHPRSGTMTRSVPSRSGCRGVPRTSALSA